MKIRIRSGRRPLRCTRRSIFIVNSGTERVFDGEIIETLGRQSVFGVKQVLLGRPTEFEFRTAGPCRIYEVPGAALVGIPIVMWKRLETFELRSAAHSGPFIKAAFPA